MDTATKRKLISACRWVAVLPGAIAAAFVAHFFMRLVTMFSMQPDSDLMRALWDDGTANAVFGGTFVYAAGWIAPAHKKYTVYVFAFIVVLLTGMILFPIVQRKEWLTAVTISFEAIAAALVAFAASEGEIDKELGIAKKQLD